MRVLVTGGCGFIGSHVVELFCEKGFDVVILDNLSTSSKANVQHLLEEYNVELIATSVSQIDRVNKKIHGIIHLGQPSSSSLYWRYFHLFSSTINEMLTILVYAQRLKCPVVYASSSSVYANNLTPWRENMRITPFDRYGEVKYISERLGALWAKRHKIKFIALRLFSVYGEREEFKGNFANLFTQLIWSGITKKTLKILCNGVQSRDLVYVKDVAEAFYKAFEIVNEEEPGYFDVFNVGTGVAISIREMEKILAYSMPELEPLVVYINEYPEFYIFRTLADTRKSRAVLKWQAKTRPQDVASNLVKYYKRKLHIIDLWNPELPGMFSTF